MKHPSLALALFLIISVCHTPQAAADHIPIPIPETKRDTFYQTGNDEPKRGALRNGVLSVSKDVLANEIRLYTRKDVPFATVYPEKHTALDDAIKQAEGIKLQDIDQSDSGTILETHAITCNSLQEKLEAMDKALRIKSSKSDGRIYKNTAIVLPPEDLVARLGKLASLRKAFAKDHDAVTKAIREALTATENNTKTLTLLDKPNSLHKAEVNSLSRYVAAFNLFRKKYQTYLAQYKEYADQKVRIYTQWSEVRSRKIKLEAPVPFSKVTYSLTGLPKVNYPKQVPLLQEASKVMTLILPDKDYMKTQFPAATLEVASIDCAPVDASKKLADIGRSMSIWRKAGKARLSFKVVAMPDSFQGKALQSALDKAGLTYVQAGQKHPLNGLASYRSNVLPGATLHAPEGFLLSGSPVLPYPSCGDLEPTREITLIPKKALWIILASGHVANIDMMDLWDRLDPFAWDAVSSKLGSISIPKSTPVTLSIMKNLETASGSVEPFITDIWAKIDIAGNQLGESLAPIKQRDWASDFQVKPSSVASVLKKNVAQSYDKNTEVTVLIISYPGSMSTGQLPPIGRNVELNIIDLLQKSGRRGAALIDTPNELGSALKNVMKGF